MRPATQRLLGVLDQVLGNYQFSAPVGIQIGPGEPAQVLHHDDLVYPLPWPHAEVVLNSMWAFDDFTLENGATRFATSSVVEAVTIPAPSALAISNPRLISSSVKLLLKL